MSNSIVVGLVIVISLVSLILVAVVGSCNNNNLQRDRQYANQQRLQTDSNQQRVLQQTPAFAPSSPSNYATTIIGNNHPCHEEINPRNTKEFLVRRMQQGVILKVTMDNGTKNGFADFGIDDPIPVEVCAICQVDFDQGDRVVTSTCTHIFHRDCLLEWVILNKDCPCCRRVFVDPEAASLRPALALE